MQRQSAAKAELQEQAERLTRGAQSVAQRRAGVEAELEAARDAQGALIANQEALATQIERLTAQVTEAGEAVRTMTGQVDTLRGEHAEIEQELHGLQLRLGEVKVRLETLVSRTMEELQLD